jgi:hypothetical protein
MDKFSPNFFKKLHGGFSTLPSKTRNCFLFIFHFGNYSVARSCRKAKDCSFLFFKPATVKGLKIMALATVVVFVARGAQAPVATPPGPYFPIAELKEKNQAFAVSENKFSPADEAESFWEELQQFSEGSLPGMLQAKKHLGLSMAACILSVTAAGAKEQRKWSLLAIGYGEMALESLGGFEDFKLRQEINSRILVGMALNYYQKGEIGKDELAAQFQKIDKEFLVGSGFCSYKILRALQDEGILKLPGAGFRRAT